jgi:proliferating cell nuclear antigen
MKLVVTEPVKKDIFIAIFQLLKGCSHAINIYFKEEFLYIQGMDRSHICLFEIHIKAGWFSEYTLIEGDSNSICVPVIIFQNILGICSETQSIVIHYEGDDLEKINIDLLVGDVPAKNNKKVVESNKYFTIPLVEFDCELLSIPEIEYDAEFSMNSKKVTDIVSQLLLFGDTMNIHCSEEEVTMGSSGVDGEMHVKIPIEDLSEFSINEGDTISNYYSLQNISKLCLSSKLSQEIEFSISKEVPMRIKYDLTGDSYIRFFIAPKIDNSD